MNTIKTIDCILYILFSFLYDLNNLFFSNNKLQRLIVIIIYLSILKTQVNINDGSTT